MHEFEIGTSEGSKTYTVFEWISEEESVAVCWTSDLKYAEFIAAALTHCKEFSPGVRIPCFEDAEIESIN